MWCSTAIDATTSKDSSSKGWSRADLASGRWERRHRDLLAQDTYDGGYRIVIAG